MDLDEKQSDLVDDQDVSASSADVSEDVTAAQADQADAEAATPTATDEPTAEDIVKAKLAEMRPEAEPEDPDPEAKEAKGEGEADPKAKAEEKDDKAGKPEDKEDRLSDEEMKALSSRARGRIGTLTRERHTERERAEAAIAQVENLQPRAEAFDTIDSALKESNLSYEDFGNLVTVGAVIRSGDPQKIIEVLTPYWQEAQQALGNEFLPDFQRKVDANEMTVEAAQEAQRNHMTAQRAQQELDARTQAEQQQTQAQQEQAQLAQTLTEATNNEFSKLTANHPDPKSLIPLMQEGIKSYVAQHGAVTDPQAARLLVQHVYQQAEAKAAKPKPPAKKATNPAPEANGPTAAAPKEPVSAASILQGVLQKTRSA